MFSRAAVLGLSIALAAPALAGCSSGATAAPDNTPSTVTSSPHSPSTPATRQQLIGHWQVIQVANVAVQHPEQWEVRGGADLTFFANGTVDGTDSTNGYSGHFTLASERLHFTGVYSTAVGLFKTAPDYRKALQAAYSSLLQSGKPVTARLHGTDLVLEGDTYAVTLTPTLHG